VDIWIKKYLCCNPDPVRDVMKVLKIQVHPSTGPVAFFLYQFPVALQHRHVNLLRHETYHRDQIRCVYHRISEVGHEKRDFGAVGKKELGNISRIGFLRDGRVRRRRR
jgi:hypothetical protein